MRQLPPLERWTQAREGLHQALVVLRSARHLGVPPQPNELEYSTIPTAFGATTGQLRGDARLDLDYAAARIHVVHGGERVAAVELDGPLTSVFDAAFEALGDAGLDGEPDRSKLAPAPVAPVDGADGAAYAEVQWRMHGVLARLKSRLTGMQTPIALWPHGFDLSSLWFASGADEHADPHVNLGFSPGTSDVAEPYFYLYAWPAPEAQPHSHVDLEWQAAWSTPGLVLRWSRFAAASDPEGAALECLEPALAAVCSDLGRRSVAR